MLSLSGAFLGLHLLYRARRQKVTPFIRKKSTPWRRDKKPSQLTQVAFASFHREDSVTRSRIGTLRPENGCRYLVVVGVNVGCSGASVGVGGTGVGVAVGGTGVDVDVAGLTSQMMVLIGNKPQYRLVT